MWLGSLARRRRWFLGAMLAVVGACGLVGSWSAPRYRAEATLLVTAGDGAAADEAARLRAPALLRQVAARLLEQQLPRRLPAALPAGEARAAALGAYLAPALVVTPAAPPGAVRVTLEWGDGDDAAAILGELLRGYLAARPHGGAAAGEPPVLALKRGHDAPDPAGEVRTNLALIKDLELSRTALAGERRTLEAERGLLERDLADAKEHLFSYLDNDAVHDLSIALRRLLVRREELRRANLPDGLALRNVDGQLARVNELLRQEAASHLERYKARLAAAEAGERAVAEQVAALTARNRELLALQFEIEGLAGGGREASAAAAGEVLLLQGVRRLAEPVWPDTTLLLLISLLGGPLAGLVAAWLAARLDPRVAGERDLIAATGLPLLLTLPEVAGLEGVRRPAVAVAAAEPPPLQGTSPAAAAPAPAAAVEVPPPSGAARRPLPWRVPAVLFSLCAVAYLLFGEEWSAFLAGGAIMPWARPERWAAVAPPPPVPAAAVAPSAPPVPPVPPVPEESPATSAAPVAVTVPAPAEPAVTPEAAPPAAPAEEAPAVPQAAGQEAPAAATAVASGPAEPAEPAAPPVAPVPAAAPQTEPTAAPPLPPARALALLGGSRALLPQLAASRLRGEAESGGGVYLQVAAQAERRLAEADAQAFRAAGWPAEVREAVIDGRHWFRIWVGPFGSAKEAKELRRAAAREAG